MTAYTMLGIPGWETLSLHSAARSDCERRIKELVLQAVPNHLPRDSATPFRRELHRHFLRLVDEARLAGAAVLSLPVQRMGDLAVPASYTVAEWRDSAGELGPEAMLEQLMQASDAAVTQVEVDGQAALREDSVQVPDPVEEPLASQPARRICYTVLAPGQQHSWIIFTFTTLGDGDPDGELANVLVRLFDAQISTLRWTEA